jgi:hypothetical protein
MAAKSVCGGQINKKPHWRLCESSLFIIVIFQPGEPTVLNGQVPALYFSYSSQPRAVHSKQRVHNTGLLLLLLSKTVLPGALLFL